MYIPKDSPVETYRKTELKRGDGKFKSFDYVYNRLQAACYNIAKQKYGYLNGDHVYLMAASGCGDEEEMKHAMALARVWGLIV